MKKSILFFNLLISIIISSLINFDSSYAIDCSDPITLATHSCDPQPTQLLSNPITYIGTTTSCCLMACTTNASFIDDCYCDSGYYMSGTTSCLASSYTVILNPNGGIGGISSVTATYNQSMPTPISLPTWTGHIFNGYTDLSNVFYYNASGASVRSWNKPNNSILYASWSTCPIGTGINGTIHSMAVNNVCRYYIICNNGFENNSYYDSSHTSTSSSLTCTSCSNGYYCPGGVRQKCPAGKTSDAGSVITEHCYIKGGSNGTKFCDNNGCFYIPYNVSY